MAMEYVPFLDQEMPDLTAEARGIADSAQVDLAVVMVLNLRYELLHPGSLCTLRNSDSGVAVQGVSERNRSGTPWTAMAKNLLLVTVQTGHLLV